jgi:hypothetical protein
MVGCGTAYADGLDGLVKVEHHATAEMPLPIRGESWLVFTILA